MGSSSLRGRDVVILAGGLGTRIRPVLGDTPKALAPLAVDGNAVMLGLLLDQLAAQGADRTVLALGHRAAAIIDWLNDGNVPVGLTVETVVEPEPLGTAGALRHVRPHLRQGPTVVMNGDTIVDVDMTALLARQMEAGCDVTVFCLRVPDAGRFGRITLTSDGWIMKFAEKDQVEGPGVVNAGVYVFSDAALDAIAASGAVSLERDVLQQVPVGAAAALMGTGRFIDIGTREGLAEARDAIAAKRR